MNSLPLKHLWRMQKTSSTASFMIRLTMMLLIAGRGEVSSQDQA